MTAEEFKTMTVTQTFLAKVLGLTQGRISQLLDEGILIRDEESRQPRFYESLKSYWLSKKTTGEGVNFWTEKALHEKAKRELSELKLAQERGEVYAAADVESVLVEMLIDFRNKLTGLGHKLAAQLEGKTATEICGIIDSEIELDLKELSENVKAESENDKDNGAEIARRTCAYGK
ncbi:MAG: hypothetical protein IJP68_05855 [Selenomonadaceae bacterium]|nr:hypothetical protein [Selenomonadaceae bacterium]